MTYSIVGQVCTKVLVQRVRKQRSVTRQSFWGTEKAMFTNIQAGNAVWESHGRVTYSLEPP